MRCSFERRKSIKITKVFQRTIRRVVVNQTKYGKIKVYNFITSIKS